jgi:hypothetical protein
MGGSKGKGSGPPSDKTYRDATLVYYLLAMNIHPMSLCELILNNPVWADWALVVVGMLTLIVIAVQTIATAQAAKATKNAAKATQDSVIAIRRQVDLMEQQTAAAVIAASAAQRSADATSLNVQAIINSERAWIAAELIPMALNFDKIGWHRRMGSNWAAMSTEEVLRGDHLRHKLRFTNMGRTPAFIIKWEIKCVRTHLPIELVTFGQPYRSLAGGASMDIEDEFVDVSSYTKEGADLTWFKGSISYRHCFSESEVIEEPFAYFLNQKSSRLEWVPIDKTDENPV